MRVAVIGLGSIGRRHVSNLLALGCDVFGYDRDDVVRSRAHVLFPGADISEWARLDQVDAVVVASPWDTHLHWAEQVFAQGVPLFIEKPLGSLEQLPRWREIAAMDLPVNQVGYQLRFHPAIRQIREFVRQPEAGSFYCDCDMSTWPGRSYGDPLLEASHELDLALWCGAPMQIRASLKTETQCDLWLDEEERWLFSLDATSTSYRRHWGLANATHDATARFNSPEELGNEMYVDEMRHFLDCVKENKPTICPLSEGLKVLEICAQVEQMTRANAS